jgi:pimeloyl-ACP methyl ester carboxylesterase
VLGDVGHFPHEEAPARFNRLLVDWLRVLPAAGGRPVNG